MTHMEETDDEADEATLTHLKREALTVLRNKDIQAYEQFTQKKARIDSYTTWLYNHLIDEEIYDGRLEYELYLVKKNQEGLLLGQLKGHIMKAVHGQLTGLGLGLLK